MNPLVSGFWDAVSILVNLALVAGLIGIGWYLGRECPRVIYAWIVAFVVAAAVAILAAVQLGKYSASPVPEAMGGDEEIGATYYTGEDRLRRSVAVFLIAWILTGATAHASTRFHLARRQAEQERWREERARRRVQIQPGDPPPANVIPASVAQQGNFGRN